MISIPEDSCMTALKFLCAYPTKFKSSQANCKTNFQISSQKLQDIQLKEEHVPQSFNNVAKV